MTGQRGDVTGVHGHRGSQLILDREIATHRIRREVVKLDSAQSQSTGVDRERIQRSTTEACLECRSPGGRGSGAARKVVDRVGVVRVEEREIELEWIVFSKIGRKPSVLEAVIEDAEPPPRNQLAVHLIRKAHTRRKVRLL